jgi:hypothetical protein
MKGDMQMSNGCIKKYSKNKRREPTCPCCLIDMVAGGIKLSGGLYTGRYILGFADIEQLIGNVKTP